MKVPVLISACLESLSPRFYCKAVLFPEALQRPQPDGNARLDGCLLCPIASSKNPVFPMASPNSPDSKNKLRQYFRCSVMSTGVSSKSVFPRVTSRSVCLPKSVFPRVSSQECFPKSVFPRLSSRVSSQDCLQECIQKCIHKNVAQECHTRVSRKGVQQECLTRVSRNRV